MDYYQPNYLTLYKSGELEKRAKRLWQRLAACDICPHECGVDRLKGNTGRCHSGYLPIVAALCDHHGEEPVLSGKHGSGTIFFGNCNLRCCYCQNYYISQDHKRQKANEVECHTLSDYLIYLQDKLGCHNINFVSPSHFVPQIMQALLDAIPKGLRIPLVYNTNSYDSLKTLKELDGIIDIYLPDLKYNSDSWSRKYSTVNNYVSHSRKAIKEMYHQVGELMVDSNRIAQGGLIVRHLILPNNIAGSRQSLIWLAKEVSPKVNISLMSQYHPTHKAYRYPLLARHIHRSEYEEAYRAMVKAGLGDGWVQDITSHKHYLPDFKRNYHPFDSNF